MNTNSTTDSADELRKELQLAGLAALAAPIVQADEDIRSTALEVPAEQNDDLISLPRNLVQRISHAMHCADVLCDAIPTRLQNHDDSVIANIGALVNEQGVYNIIAVAKRELYTFLASPAVDVQGAATEQEPLVFDDYPNFNSEAMGCGLEDRGITDRYDAMRYGWDEAMERVGERIDSFVSDLERVAAPVAPAEPSNTIWTAITRLERQDSTFTERMAAADDLRILAATPPIPAPIEQHDAADLVMACRNLIAYVGQNPPMGDSLWCVQQIRAALGNTSGESSERAPTEPSCNTCPDTGEMYVETSGLDSDGNAPVTERCPECGYLDMTPEPTEPMGSIGDDPEFDNLLDKFALAAACAYDDGEAGESLHIELVTYIDSLLAASKAAPAKLTDETEKQAARYRYLRDPKINVALVIDKVTGAVPADEFGCGGYRTYEYRAGDELDAAIDAAITAQVSGQSGAAYSAGAGS